MKKNMTALFILTLGLLTVFSGRTTVQAKENTAVGTETNTEADSENETRTGCVWNTEHFKNSSEYYLYMDASGYTMTREGKIVSPCYLRMYAEKNLFSFTVFDAEGKAFTNVTDSRQESPICFAFELMNLGEVMTTVSMESGSNEMVPGEVTNLSGFTMTPQAMMRNEMMGGGSVSLYLPIGNFNGTDDAILYFCLPQYDGQFAELYLAADADNWGKENPDTAKTAGNGNAAAGNTPAATGTQAANANKAEVQTYTNEEIEKIAQAYMSQYDSVAPKAYKWYNIVFGEEDLNTSDYLGLALSGLSILLSDDPEAALGEKMAEPLMEIVNFFEAKAAFDSLEYARMTTAQRDYCQKVADLMNQQDIIQIIDILSVIYQALA